MSMILDALTRAEHERQLEKQPDLKFVNPVKSKKNNPKRIWLWIGLGLLVNVLIIFLIVRSITGDGEPEVEIAAAEKQIATQEIVSPSNVVSPQKQFQQANSISSNKDINQQVIHSEIAEPIQPLESIESRPLAMEVGSAQSPEVDRPLIYESKQTNTKPMASATQNIVTAPSTSVKKGKVSFSSTELSADDAVPITEKPKLLIDQGESVTPNLQTRSSSVPNLRDLPESARNSLNQYEVNVHVFDTDPIRRFVLINMDKYKEGDRIVNNGPLVEEITPKGVVVDYGSGRALLPPK